MHTQVQESWNMLALHGTRAASSATAVNSLLAPSPSSLTKTSITAYLVMRTSLLHGARVVKRSDC